MSPKRMTDMKPKEWGIISEKNLPSVHFMEMGILPGTPFQYIRSALRGTPIAIAIRGYFLSLGKKDAEEIWVEPYA